MRDIRLISCFHHLYYNIGSSRNYFTDFLKNLCKIPDFYLRFVMIADRKISILGVSRTYKYHKWGGGSSRNGGSSRYLQGRGSKTTALDALENLIKKFNKNLGENFFVIIWPNFSKNFKSSMFFSKFSQNSTRQNKNHFKVWPIRANTHAIKLKEKSLKHLQTCSDLIALYCLLSYYIKDKIHQLIGLHEFAHIFRFKTVKMQINMLLFIHQIN